MMSAASLVGYELQKTMKDVEDRGRLAREATERTKIITELQKKVRDQELLIEYLVQREVSCKQRELERLKKDLFR